VQALLVLHAQVVDFHAEEVAGEVDFEDLAAWAEGGGDRAEEVVVVRFGTLCLHQM
jgi:hypothetical protein